jgi:glycosyltransferase involved in cell wall biosynthesis
MSTESFGKNTKHSMRILVVTQYFWPENFRINDLVQALSERGHQITILTGEPNYPSGNFYPEYLINKSGFTDFNGSKVIRIPVLVRKNNRISLFLSYLSFIISASLIGIWKLRRLPFDVIFVYAPSPITVGIPAALFKKIKKAPMAFWVLDLWPHTLQAVGIIKSQFFLNLIGRIVKFVYSHCDLILAQSKSFINHIKQYSPPDVPVEYFPNWAELVFEQFPTAPAPEIIKKPGDFIIMFAGNLGEAQDFPAILNAAELLRTYKNIRWIILGDGRMREWISQEIINRDLINQFELLGSYPVDRMPSFFMHSDVLLVTLKDEPIFAMTIPGKLQSYLASGIPILGMLNGEGAALINENSVGICVPAGEFKKLAQSIIIFKDMDIQSRNAFGIKGKKIYVNEFERNKVIIFLEKLFEKLVSKSDSPR